MSYKIESGLFKLDFTDHHAVLGIPIDAEAKDIRKQYLKIARRLHPDSCKAETEREKQFASQLLSKLVNPAYEQLFPDKNRAEYTVILARMGKRVVSEAANLQPKGEPAKQLSQVAGNIDLAYKDALQKLAKQQYESIDKILEMTAQISELNMVYLMRKESKGESMRVPARAGAGMGTTATGTKPSGTNSADKSKEGAGTTSTGRTSLADPYLRRAEELMSKNQFAMAEMELREALKLEPNNSRCHSLLGMAYLKQHKNTMAKVHITQALKLNPQEPVATEGKQALEKLAQGASGSKTTTPPKTSQGKPPQGKPDDKSGGGLFGGLFGGKKK